jgi:hypothetical protein
LFGLGLEVVEAPLLKIEAAVDQEGKVAAVRCRAALDLGVEAVFEDAAPGYRLKEAAGVGAVKRAGAGWIACWRREFSGLPVYVGVEEGYVYVKRTAPMDPRRFRKYTDVGGWASTGGG